MNKLKSTSILVLTIIAGSLVGNVSIYYDIVFFSGLIFLLAVVTYFMKKAEQIVDEGSLEELNQCLKELENSNDLDEKSKQKLIIEIQQKIELKQNASTELKKEK